MTAPVAAPLEIFVPYWGDPDLLRTTVDSVRGQRDPRWTLTVVDDCYPDPSVAELFASESDQRIRYRRNEENLGIAGNFQRCLDLASGEAVVFLGCDDVMLPDYVARAHALLAAFPDADVFQPGVQVIDSAGRQVVPLGDRVKAWLRPRTRGPLVLSGEELAASLLRGNWLYWPSLVFRTKKVQRHAFRQDLPIILDLALVLDMVADGSALVLDPAVTFAYRRHATSLSGTTLSDGSRFAQDRRYFADAAAQMRGTGWTQRGARGSTQVDVAAARAHPPAGCRACPRRPQRAAGPPPRDLTLSAADELSGVPVGRQDELGDERVAAGVQRVGQRDDRRRVPHAVLAQEGHLQDGWDLVAVQAHGLQVVVGVQVHHLEVGEQLRQHRLHLVEAAAEEDPVHVVQLEHDHAEPQQRRAVHRFEDGHSAPSMSICSSRSPASGAGPFLLIQLSIVVQPGASSVPTNVGSKSRRGCCEGDPSTDASAMKEGTPRSASPS